jgi:hypothetical protein
MAVLSEDASHYSFLRDSHIILKQAKGRLGRQKQTDYGRRSPLVKTTLGHHKAIIGPGLRACRPAIQRTEAAVLSCMPDLTSTPKFRPLLAKGFISPVVKGDYFLSEGFM